MSTLGNRISYWRWKARQGRVAAHHMTDPAERLTLLKMAEICEQIADRWERGWVPHAAAAHEPERRASRAA